MTEKRKRDIIITQTKYATHLELKAIVAGHALYKLSLKYK
jgi:hypothetical protein